MGIPSRTSAPTPLASRLRIRHQSAIPHNQQIVPKSIRKRLERTTVRRLAEAADGGANFPGDHPPPRFDVAVLAVRVEVAAYQLLCSHVVHVLEASRGKECGRLALVDSESERLAAAAHFGELVRRPAQRAGTLHHRAQCVIE